ncbi:hypothetical protein [Enterobacter kobei]|uniref:hypothetical protein n=1 Tax=Enterobacter kobei TaxID=208224 RepID=UPI003A987CE3
MTTTPYRYQFVAEPITNLSGQLLGVELQTRLEKEGQQVLHPELIVAGWSTDEKRDYLYEQLGRVAKQSAWIRGRNVLVTLPVCDAASAVLLSYDAALRGLLSTLPFVRLALAEPIADVRDELQGIHNAMWLSDVGGGRANVIGLMSQHFEAVILNSIFFKEEVVKPTFPVLIKNLRRYCDKVVVRGVTDRRCLPILQDAGIWGVQGSFYRQVPLEKLNWLL